VKIFTIRQQMFTYFTICDVLLVLVFLIVVVLFDFILGSI